MQFYSLHTCFPFISHLYHFLSLRRARNPTNQGERELMLDRQSSPDGFVLRETADCCNKPYRPLRPWWTGSRLFQEVTVQLAEQATSQNFGSPAASTSISPRGITPRGLHPNYYMSQFICQITLFYDTSL
jgi:hypothetical protein